MIVSLPEVKDLCRKAVKDTGVPPMLLAAMAVCESGDRKDPEAGCDANAVRKEPQIGDESRGLVQILTRTCEEVGGDPGRLFEPLYNLEIGARYTLACYRYISAPGPEDDRWLLAVAGYNCGMGRVSKALRRSPAGSHWQTVLTFLDGHPEISTVNEQITRRHVADCFRLWRQFEADEDHEA